MIRPKPLLSAIVPPRLTYHGEDAPAPAGSEGTPPAGGGGGDPNADIISFTPPDIGNVSEILTGKKAGDTNTPAPKGKDPAPPAAKTPPAAPAAKDPPAKQLREELDAVKKERDELKQTMEKGDPRLAQAEAAVKAKEAEIKGAQEKLADYERRLAMADPEVTKELVEKDGAYDATAGKFYSAVPELSRDQVHSLVREYNSLPFGKPEYKAARGEFEQKVNAALGAADGAEHRKLERALEFIERTHEFALERPKIVDKIQRSALELQRKAQEESWSKKNTSVKEALARAKQVPDGLSKTDPYHPKVMIDTFMKGFTPEQKAELEKGVEEYVELVASGLKPRGDQDYAGMTPEKIAESKANEKERLEKARTLSIDVMYNGLMAMRMFPSLVKDWQRLNAKLKTDAEGNPPDPSGNDGGQGGKDADNIREFRPPNLNDLKF